MNDFFDGTFNDFLDAIFPNQPEKNAELANLAKEPEWEDLNDTEDWLRNEADKMPKVITDEFIKGWNVIKGVER